MLRARFFSTIAIFSLCLAAAATAADASGNGSTLNVQLECALDINGRISGGLEISATGQAGELLREWVLGLPPAERQAAAGYFLDRIIPGADILSSDSQYAEQPPKPVVVSCKFRTDIFAASGKGIIQIPTLLSGELLINGHLASLVEIKQAETDVVSVDPATPIEIIFIENITLPDGYSLRGEGSLAGLESGPARLRGELTGEQNTVKRILELEISARAIPAEELEDARSVINDFLGWRTDAVAVGGGQ